MIDYNKIKYYRELNNLEIKDVAKKMKKSKKIIEEWENGNREINDKDLEKIANIFNIDIDDLYYKNNDKVNILVILVLLIVSIITCLIIKNYYLFIIVPISFINVYLLYMSLKDKYTLTTNENIPKSVLNFVLTDNKKSRFILYFLECNIISSSYIVFATICELFNFKLFIYNINIISNENVNKLIIFIGIYLLLLILSFIIELVFGEKMLKKKRED